MEKSKVKKGARVKYNGINRSYLKDYPVAELTGDYASTSSSALVEFKNKSGVAVDTAWVGVGYLEIAAFTHQSTIDDLEKKKAELITQIAGFDAAIKALQDLG